MTANQSQTRSSTAVRQHAGTNAADGSTGSRHRADRPPHATDTGPDPDTDELLALLGDEYVVDIVETLTDGPLPARALADRCGMSRATVYRRLERLTDAGLVTSHLAIEGNGHHRQQFHLVLDELQFAVDEDGFDCTVTLGDTASD